MKVLATDVISLLILIIGLLSLVNFSLYFWIRKNELDIEALKKERDLLNEKFLSK